MWFLLLGIAIVWALATPAEADDLSRIEGRQHGRAFWLSTPGWPTPPDEPDSHPKPKFTMTYTDGVAARLHLSGGNSDLFARKLGGWGTPAIVGTMDHGAALVALRWRADD
jgi:hypothetical protein